MKCGREKSTTIAHTVVAVVATVIATHTSQAAIVMWRTMWQLREWIAIRYLIRRPLDLPRCSASRNEPVVTGSVAATGKLYLNTIVKRHPPPLRIYFSYTIPGSQLEILSFLKRSIKRQLI